MTRERFYLVRSWCSANLAHTPLTEGQEAHLTKEELREMHRLMDEVYDRTARIEGLMGAAVFRKEQADK